jgi:hypothetical protein
MAIFSLLANYELAAFNRGKERPGKAFTAGLDMRMAQYGFPFIRRVLSALMRGNKIPDPYSFFRKLTI